MAKVIKSIYEKQFLAIIERNPITYDAKLQSLYGPLAVADMWRQISQFLEDNNFPFKDAENKWIKLRRNFIGHYNKSNRSYYLYDNMLFLVGHFRDNRKKNTSSATNVRSPIPSTSSGQQPTEHFIQKRTHDVVHPPLCPPSTSGHQQFQNRSIKLEESSTNLKHEVLLYPDEVIDVEDDDSQDEDNDLSNADYLSNENTRDSCSNSSNNSLETNRRLNFDSMRIPQTSRATPFPRSEIPLLDNPNFLNINRFETNPSLNFDDARAQQLSPATPLRRTETPTLGNLNSPTNNGFETNLFWNFDDIRAPEKSPATPLPRRIETNPSVSPNSPMNFDDERMPAMPLRRSETPRLGNPNFLTNNGFETNLNWNFDDIRAPETSPATPLRRIETNPSVNPNPPMNDGFESPSLNFDDVRAPAATLRRTETSLSANLNHSIKNGFNTNPSLNLNGIPVPKTSSSIQFQPVRIAFPKNSNLSTSGTIKKQITRQYKSVNPFTSVPVNACTFPRVSDIPQSTLSPNEPIVPPSDKFSRNKRNTDCHIVKIQETLARSADDFHSIATNVNETMQLKAEVLKKQLEPGASDALFRLLMHDWMHLTPRAQGEILSSALDIMEKYSTTP